MKKLIFTIVLLMGIVIQAQTNGALKGGGIVFADSLKCWRDSTGGTATYYAADSSKIYKLNLDWGFISITVTDSGATYTDSLKCYKGSVRYTDGYSHTIVDTIWSTNALPFKNNFWNVDTTMVGAAKTSNYMLLDNNIQLLKIVRVNHVATGLGLGINTPIIVEAKKD